MREDWDQVRFTLLTAVASIDAPAVDETIWSRLLELLVDAYDRPVPPYSIYRELRTFALIRWPQLATILAGDVDPEALLEEVIQVLQRAIDARERGTVDALEVEMALLSELLDASGGHR